MHNESETACNLGPNQSSNMDVNQKNRGLVQANSNNADNKNIRGTFIISCSFCHLIFVRMFFYYVMSGQGMFR